jgi:nicotinate-nucleotide adenylyltransferase
VRQPHRREPVAHAAGSVVRAGDSSVRVAPAKLALRTAMFGGTFDPIHNAHLDIARAAADRFQLARVLFVPAANPPHKVAGAAASWEDRVRMVELACAVDPRFEVSLIEAPAEQNAEPSYTVLAIEKLQALGVKPLSCLIGADAFAEIRTWYRWKDIVAAVEFIVVTRPGASWETPPGAIVHELSGLALPVSSSEIRRQVIEGAAPVPVPETVRAYIREHGLYRSQPK